MPFTELTVGAREMDGTTPPVTKYVPQKTALQEPRRRLGRMPFTELTVGAAETSGTTLRPLDGTSLPLTWYSPKKALQRPRRRVGRMPFTELTVGAAEPSGTTLPVTATKKLKQLARSMALP